MSDHPNPNIHRGDGANGRGLLIAFALIVAVVVLLALVGTMGGGSDGAIDGTAIMPAGENPIAPASETAPAATE